MLGEPLTSVRRDSLAGSEGSRVQRCEVPYGGATEPRTEGRLQATANEETMDPAPCEKWLRFGLNLEVTSPQQTHRFQPCERPGVKGLSQAVPGFLVHRNLGATDACCFTAAESGVICYPAVAY